VAYKEGYSEVPWAPSALPFGFYNADRFAIVVDPQTEATTFAAVAEPD